MTFKAVPGVLRHRPSGKATAGLFVAFSADGKKTVLRGSRQALKVFELKRNVAAQLSAGNRYRFAGGPAVVVLEDVMPAQDVTETAEPGPSNVAEMTLDLAGY